MYNMKQIYDEDTNIYLVSCININNFVYNTGHTYSILIYN
jgi:hypothetical protein